MAFEGQKDASAHTQGALTFKVTPLVPSDGASAALRMGEFILPAKDKDDSANIWVQRENNPWGPAADLSSLRSNDVSSWKNKAASDVMSFKSGNKSVDYKQKITKYEVRLDNPGSVVKDALTRGLKVWITDGNTVIADKQAIADIGGNGILNLHDYRPLTGDPLDLEIHMEFEGAKDDQAHTQGPLTFRVTPTDPANGASATLTTGKLTLPAKDKDPDPVTNCKASIKIYPGKDMKGKRVVTAKVTADCGGCGKWEIAADFHDDKRAPNNLDHYQYFYEESVDFTENAFKLFKETDRMGVTIQPPATGKLSIVEAYFQNGRNDTKIIAEYRGPYHSPLKDKVEGTHFLHQVYATWKKVSNVSDASGAQDNPKPNPSPPSPPKLATTMPPQQNKRVASRRARRHMV